ncbi:MAG: helix-turn-helix domain-containing protein [Proteobacteria bacterium]|nr:helix-turn-helix domain-containing protein [Pseudomonadota bacterium]
MKKQTIRRGRPPGTSTYDAKSAIAFGAAVREERTRQGIVQEALSHLAGIERSHLGKIERGEHAPTLPIILKLACALKCSAAHLLAATEAKLPMRRPITARNDSV